MNIEEFKQTWKQNIKVPTLRFGERDFVVVIDKNHQRFLQIGQVEDKVKDQYIINFCNDGGTSNLKKEQILVLKVKEEKEMY